MQENRYEIRLSGSGGQGIILAAVVLAEAAGINSGHHVCQTQSYGPEARGGKCKAEVVISDLPIDYPRVVQLDLLLAMNQASCDAYFYDFKPNGLLLVDSTMVEQVPTSRVISLPFTRFAQEEAKTPMAANMAALGTISHFCPWVTPAAMENALINRVPAKSVEANRAAFLRGLAAAREIDISALPRSIISQEDEEL